MQAIIQVRCHEPPVKGERIGYRDRRSLDVAVLPRTGGDYERGLVADFAGDIAVQLGRVRRMKPGDMLVAQVHLKPWTAKYYDNYWGAWEYDAGVDVLKSRTLVYRKGA